MASGAAENHTGMLPLTKVVNNRLRNFSKLVINVHYHVPRSRDLPTREKHSLRHSAGT